MKNTELRIGNLVEYDNGIYPIYSLSNEYPFLDTDEFGVGIVEYHNINPIILTEEWLKKFGFEYDEGDDLYFKIEYDCYGNESDPICLSENMYGFRHIAIHYDIEYVHQLQNLYFALTGEELNLTK